MAESPRVVLLGASNLTRGLACLLANAKVVLGAPALDVHAALGRGRSYGVRSKLLGRSLEGIIESHLWHVLTGATERIPLPPPFALITDIGNDVMYGIEPSQIIEWIDACVCRLQHSRAIIVITPPPIESIRRVTRLQYRIVKRLLFPKHDISFTTAFERAEELTVRVRQLASDRGIHTVEHDASWYGLDPIHIRRSSLPQAWLSMMRPWKHDPSEDQAPVRSSLLTQLRIEAAHPLRWERAGRVRITPQPCRILQDGTRIHLY